MQSHLERIWNNTIHRTFIEGLDSVQSSALLKLLTIAVGADDDVTREEQDEVRRALAELPAFQPAAFALDEASYDRDVARVLTEYEEDPETVLASIEADLGDDATRRHAFRTTVQFLQADGFAPGEEAFVRVLARRFGIEPEVVDFAVADARKVL